MNVRQKTLRGFQFAFNKGGVQNQLGLLVTDLCLAPLLDLSLHGFEVPLNLVDTDCKRIRSS
jgi:hypothetical protein